MPRVLRVRADDRSIVEFASVSDAEWLRRSSLFVAEGRLVVQRVIEDGRYRMHSMLLSETAWRALQPDVAGLAADVPVYVIPAEAFRDVTGFDLHRGCIALVERPPAQSLPDVVSHARLVVVLEDLANPDNVGGVFRNAAAFGADAVLLSPHCCDPLYRKAIRTSMAASLRVPFARVENWPADLHWLRSQGFMVVALTPHDPADRLESVVSWKRPLALLAGAEGSGLSAHAHAAADVRIRIPLNAAVDSLNVAVAVGIALHAIAGKPIAHG